MSIYTPNQQEIAEKLSTKGVSRADWKDWRWQLKHSIQSLAAVERLLDIRFSAEEKVELEKTLDRFPLSVTPYYLSLINAADYRNDPIFMQAFPSPRELEIERNDMAPRSARGSRSWITSSATPAVSPFRPMSSMPPAGAARSR